MAEEKIIRHQAQTGNPKPAITGMRDFTNWEDGGFGVLGKSIINSIINSNDRTYL